MTATTQTDVVTSQVQPLAERWWVPAVRGFAALLFGAATLVVVYGVATLMPPSTGVRTMAVLWGVYAGVDGILNLVAAFRGAGVGRRWGWFFFEGIVSLLVAAVAFAWGEMTALAFLGLVATWALLTGLAEVAAAIRLRQYIRGEWILAASGVLSILLGLLLLALPGARILLELWMIVVYAFAFGALLIGLGVRLQRWGQRAPLRRGLRTSV